MDSILNRYRNITVLVMVLAAQLFLLAYQVRSRQDVQTVRSWALSGFIPLSRMADAVRSNTFGVVSNYADLLRVKDENVQVKRALDQLKLENQFLRTELATAERGKALALFLQRTPNRIVAARVVGTVTGAKAVFVDRGTNDGVQKGMAVITPDGIVGKVSASYPSGSQVILITDASFAAGVISQKNRVHGALKGQGHSTCVIEYIQNEEKVDEGEWFFTSGDDRVFPKGLPVGQVKIARAGKMFFKEVFLIPSGLAQGLEDVLIVLEGVHQSIPDTLESAQPLHLLNPPPAEPKTERERVIRGAISTDADQVFDRYKRIGTVTGHSYGNGGVPNFNVNVDPGPVPAAKPASPAGAKPAVKPPDPADGKPAQ